MGAGGLRQFRGRARHGPADDPPPMDDPDPPWGWWPFSIFADTQCRDDLYVLAETEDGQRFVHEPPVCEDGEWTVSE